MGDIDRRGDFEVRIVDAVDITHIARVDSSGRLLVSPAVATPQDTTEIIRVAQTNINANTDTIYTITNGKTLTLQILQAGAETNTTGGSKVSLFEDPNGDLSVLNLIAVLYVNGSSEEATLATTLVGNGTRRVVMRRSIFAGASREVFARWKGFEE